MSVVLDVTPLQTDHRFRGIGTYVRELYRRLYVIEPSIETWGFEEVVQELGRPPDRSAGKSRQHLIARWLSLATFGARSLDVEDLLHVTSYTAATVRPRGQYVATVFDLIPLRFPDQYLPTPTERLRYRWYLRHLQGADHLLAISGAVASDCVDMLGIAASQISITPLAPQELPEPRDRHPLGGRPFAMVIGSPDPHKNVRFAIDVAASSTHSEDLTLVMTGAHETPAQALIEEASDRSVVVLHLGHVQTQLLSDLYAHAVVCLFPSLYEGFGLPALEVLRAGGRLMVSNQGALPEVVGDAAPVLPLEVTRWTEVLDRFFSGTQPWDAERARNHADSFTWDRTARLTASTYTEVIRRLGQ